MNRLFPQPFVAVTVTALAVVALVGSWLGTLPDLLRSEGYATPLVALLLTLAVIIAYRYPIHVRYHTKVLVVTVPLYLMAVLLPPAVAGTAAGLGILTGELLERSRRRSLPSDIATAVGRIVIVILFSAVVAHLPAADGGTRVALLLLTALVMFLSDLVTAALGIAPMCEEPPFRVIAASAPEALPVEGVQYLLAILGALAALQHPAALALLVIPIALVYLAFKNAKEMRDSTRALLESMADAVDLRDPYTGGHSRRVAALSQGILDELGISGPEAELILVAARVHDIGKIGIPDEILKKPGRLTPQEHEIMNGHAERGAAFLTRYPDFARGAEIVRHHHERWNGSGYPDGLKAHDIPFGARVVAIADCFDAVTSDRPYQPARSSQQAARILHSESGELWDPRILEAFFRSIADGLPLPSTRQLQVVPRMADTDLLDTAV